MGDGLAFVIQNVIGSGSDPDPYLTSANTRSAETGSGLSVIGGGGGGMGYGRIDNSIALEADTFDDMIRGITGQTTITATTWRCRACPQCEQDQNS